MIHRYQQGLHQGKCVRTMAQHHLLLPLLLLLLQGTAAQTNFDLSKYIPSMLRAAGPGQVGFLQSTSFILQWTDTLILHG